MTYWTPEHINKVFKVFTQMKKDLAKQQLPEKVYEEYLKTFKKMATEVGVFNDKGQILLTKRMECPENPTDPFCGLWHLPGVTHSLVETIEDSKKRLISEELNGTISLDSMQYVGYHEEVTLQRGLYHSFLFIARSNDGNVPQGEFFSINDFPDNFVDYHREKIIPIIVEQFALQNPK